MSTSPRASAAVRLQAMARVRVSSSARASGGCVGLISAGTSAEESAFMDASETGGDVFFLTLSRLLPQDYDTSFDVYDAHECTAAAPCAPPAALAPPPCTDGRCVQAGADAAAGDLRGARERDVLRRGQRRADASPAVREGHEAGAEARQGAEKLAHGRRRQRRQA